MKAIFALVLTVLCSATLHAEVTNFCTDQRALNEASNKMDGDMQEKIESAQRKGKNLDKVYVEAELKTFDGVGFNDGDEQFRFAWLFVGQNFDFDGDADYIKLLSYTDNPIGSGKGDTVKFIASLEKVLNAACNPAVQFINFKDKADKPKHKTNW